MAETFLEVMRLTDEQVEAEVTAAATPTAPSWQHQLHSRPIDIGRDTEIVHRWLVAPKAKYWEMLNSTPAEVEKMIRDSAGPGGSQFGMRIGYLDGEPQFLFELYDPSASELAAPGTGYTPEDGDLGMHLLVASSERRIPGFTANVMLHIMRTAFFEAGAQRVVVEPDVRNLEVQRLNAAVGFVVAGDYPVAGKVARLSYCTRADFVRVTDNGRFVAAADQLPIPEKAAL